MSRIFTALDAIIGPLPEEITTEIIESPATVSGFGAIMIPVFVLVATAALGIIIFATTKKSEK